MPSPVSSGLGRNGPWLQNDWLRVESRLDDGSISPIALSASFRPTERLLAGVTASGAALVFGRCDYNIDPYTDALGTGRKLTLKSHLARGAITLHREVVLYDTHPFTVTRTGISNAGGQPLPLLSIDAAATPTAGRGKLQLGARAQDWRIYRNGWQSWSPTMSLGGSQVDLRSAPPVLAPEPPITRAGHTASDDVGVLYDPQSRRSLLIGAISAHTWLSQVVVDAADRGVTARNLCDGWALDPGETAWSERFVVDLCDHPNEQLERYGAALAREMGARKTLRQPSGWCSWYYFYTEVTEADVVRNLRFLEQHRRELPIDTIQIDDGYQADIGDWLITNEKFLRGMPWLASEIKRAGYTPGIWLAPFMFSESSRSFAAHPDFIIRDESGSPALATENWQRRNFGIDGSNPDARAWLTALFRTICDEWGYDYVKVDFLFAAAIAGQRYDPAATRISAYRQALQAVRDGVGAHRFILGCGSLMAPSVGAFDGNRIGLDVAPFWRFLTTEERQTPKPRFRRPDDGLSAEGAIRNTLTRAWMHGRLWHNDPDCVLVRTDRTKLTLDETRTLATAIALSGGMVLSSDDLEKVPPDRLGILSMLLPALPHAARPLDLMLTDMPETLEWSAPNGDLRLVGLFNFDDDAKDLTYDLPEGDWHAFELWSGRYLGVSSTSLTQSLVDAHACRLVSLRPVADRPQLVGTDAHIGCGALDVVAESWDEDSSTLVITLAPIGSIQRSVTVASAGHVFASAAATSGEVQVEEGNGWVRCRVSAHQEIRVTLVFR